MFELLISFAIAAVSIVWSIWVIGQAFEDEASAQDELIDHASSPSRGREVFNPEQSNTR